jgi:hypothetical protein
MATSSNALTGMSAAEVSLVRELRTELIRQHKTLQGADIKWMASTVARVALDVEPQNEMDQLVGPFYDTATLESWLGISRQAIDQRVKARKLLACMTPDKVRLYPVWQFTDTGQTIPGLTLVLPILASGVNAPWTWAMWMVSKLPYELDGLSPAEWLTRGRDVAAVATLATQDASAWAA